MASAEELAKFELYLSEGQALWSVNPKLVVSREFFEIWEEAHRPQPFALDEPTLTIAGQVLTPVADHEGIAWFTWDFQEACATLVVENHTAEHRYLWGFADGLPQLSEQPPQWRDEREVSLGERLEVIFDIIAWYRTRYPGRDVRDLRRADFTLALAEMAPTLPVATVRVLRRTAFSRLRQLFAKAMEDMAVDELSDQLALPLDGSYAVATSGAHVPAAADAPVRHAVTIALPQRTKWAVLGDLRFMQAANQALAELEQGFIIDFRHAEIIARENPQLVVVRLPVTAGQPLGEGDRLQIFDRRRNGPVGTFFVDLRERDDALGRVAWDNGPVPEEFSDDLFARPRKSPSEYLARRLEAAVVQYGREGAFASAAVSAALGATRATFSSVTVPATVPKGLDHSQVEAWANAVQPDNPLVLIQGPPGTGKTHVLEQVLRTLVRAGQRLLFVAPSHTAVDNLCRRVGDLPLLRLGRDSDSFSPDLAKYWVGDIEAVKAMVRKRRGKECLYAGTHLGLLRDDVVAADLEKHGPFDVIVFDEAGMARLDEFLLCSGLAQRALLFGDHQQLPPFPLPDPVIERLRERGTATRRQWDTVTCSALEWLITERQLPVFLLQSSYRCQNPRLMRFSSILFYNARVKASAWAEYYRLSFTERWQRYPPWSLRLYRTSSLPLAQRRERLTIDGGKPGLENMLEAKLAVAAFYELLQRFPANEITIIAPYRRQVRLIRKQLMQARVKQLHPAGAPTAAQWEDFCRQRIATVDSFQGSESDAVIICYVRSNDGRSIGFVDDPNRVNVAHTRCRREMVIIGDLAHLQANARNDIFARMERAVQRDGVIIDVTAAMYAKLPEHLPIG